jgi:hypothetical protein
VPGITRAAVHVLGNRRLRSPTGVGLGG